MQMIDVIARLKEIAEKSPEEIGRAIDSANKMSGRPATVSEDVNINLSGNDAVLAQILKLAGMIGAKTDGDDVSSEPAMPSMPSPEPMHHEPMGHEPMDMGHDDMAMDMGMDHEEPEMEGAYDASTTPNPFTRKMDAAVPAGNDLAKPKLTAPKVSGGDNPIKGVISIG